MTLLSVYFRKMKSFYVRLVSLIVEVCHKPLLTLLTKYASSEDKHFTTLEKYVAGKKAVIGKKLSHSQWQIVSNEPTDNWDVSVCYALLNTLFKNKMQQYEKENIETIHKIRNKVTHMTETSGSSITPSQFETYWNDLKQAIIALTKNANGNVAELEAKMNNISGSLSGLEDSILKWFRFWHNTISSIAATTHSATKVITTKSGSFYIIFMSP